MHLHIVQMEDTIKWMILIGHDSCTQSLIFDFFWSTLSVSGVTISSPMDDNVTKDTQDTIMDVTHSL